MSDKLIPVAKYAKSIADMGAIVAMHALSRHVTHTARSFLNLMKLVQRAFVLMITDKQFLDTLETALQKSHELASGSWDFKRYPDGTVYIKGSFHIKQLREHLMTVPDARPRTIEINDGQ